MEVSRRLSFFCCSLVGCGAAASGAERTAPEATQEAEAAPVEAAPATTSDMRREQAQAFAEVRARAARLALARGRGAPESLAACFDASRYEENGVLPQSVQDEMFEIGRMGVRGVMLSALASGPDSPGTTQIVPRRGPPRVEDAAAFVRTDFPGESAVRTRRRDEALAAGDVRLAALFDRDGGPGWDALVAAEPAAAGLDQNGPWWLPVGIARTGPRTVELLVDSDNPDTSPMFLGICLSAIRLDEHLRDVLQSVEDPVAGYQLCLWGALLTARSHGGEGDLPVTRQWLLPYLAAMEGNLRGFVVAEIVARYAPDGLAALPGSDLEAATHYLHELYAPNES